MFPPKADLGMTGSVGAKWKFAGRSGADTGFLGTDGWFRELTIGRVPGSGFN
jgi:hypothetical protein